MSVLSLTNLFSQPCHILWNELELLDDVMCTLIQRSPRSTLMYLKLTSFWYVQNVIYFLQIHFSQCLLILVWQLSDLPQAP